MPNCPVSVAWGIEDMIFGFYPRVLFEKFQREKSLLSLGNGWLYGALGCLDKYFRFNGLGFGLERLGTKFAGIR